MENNKQLGKKDLNYINVPLSIVNQRWFKSEKAVRAWFFMAWQALMPRYEQYQTKSIKGKTFHLAEGELICTRSYLAKSLGINDSAAKCSTDKLKRTDTISVKQEILSNRKDPKGKLSRINVKGVPVPSEPYIKMYLPVKEEEFWTNKVLVQLYIYMVCNAEHKGGYIVGSEGHAIRVEKGDMRLNYKNVMAALKCKEWKLKECLRTLKESGAITTKNRIGKQGVLYHLDYYPQQKADKKVTSNVKESNRAVFSPVKSKNEQIKNTPVTEAIMYLFFDLKKNKDINHLNQIIEYVNANLPKDFCVGKLKDAMDCYYKESGDSYIQGKNVVKAIVKFHSEKRTKESAANYREKRLKELSGILSQKQNERYRLYENWEFIMRAYEIFRENGNVNSIQKDEYINRIYSALSFAVFRSPMFKDKSLHSAKPKLPVNGWDDETCKNAASIESIFERIQNDSELGKLEQCNKKMFDGNFSKEVKAINDEIEKLKTE